MNFPEDSHNAKQNHGFRRFQGSLVVLNTELMAAIFEQDYTVFLKTLEESIMAFNQLEN
ncbi:hypothetical protein SAMN05443529_12039 [Desulfosporosinus hippei DSM 8344]|uniref:Uncharacterized protein n=1 Tax=Desulfosporosinus hippei DSM 8344 TaxID=1121419 RepID=A0A1G8FPV6_9FIRM|nr:hypothetical protein SAMN05443529_12039 [Desulfosporosinus hippei DSM 8344]